jgi:hypothetical protein
LEQHDEEAYEEFSELINESYELLLDFQAYAEEAREAEDSSYRERAIVEAFSYARKLQEKKDEWDELLETVPITGLDSVEDLIIKTETYGNGLQIMEPDHGSDPDEKEMAAINAVKDNYNVLEEYDLISYDRELETDFGSIDLRISV